MKKVIIYTDGACSENPGRGGIGYVLQADGSEKKGMKGYIKSTNNRMELLAAIEALRQLKCACEVDLRSDSRYLIDPIEKGYLAEWLTEPDLMNRQNPDLWKELAFEMKRHAIVPRWIPREQNNEADKLAKNACHTPNPVYDYGYEARPKPMQQTLPLMTKPTITKPNFKQH